MIDFKVLLFLGDFTTFFFAIVAFSYLVVVGGVVKAFLAQNIVNILLIILTLWLNSYFGLSLDVSTLIAFEILTFIVSLFLLQKS